MQGGNDGVKSLTNPAGAGRSVYKPAWLAKRLGPEVEADMHIITADEISANESDELPAEPGQHYFGSI